MVCQCLRPEQQCMEWHSGSCPATALLMNVPSLGLVANCKVSCKWGCPFFCQWVFCLWTFCKLPQSLAWWELVEYFRSFFCWHQRNLEGPRREVALEDLCLLHRRWCLQAILKLGSILHFTAKPQLPAPKLTLPQLEHWSGAVFGKSTVSNPLCWAPVKTKKRDRFSVYPVQGCMCFSTIFRNFLWKSWQWMIYFK